VGVNKNIELQERRSIRCRPFYGACMLVKKELIKKIGGLDEIYSPFLLEDSDLFLRAKKIGYNINVLTSIKIIHKKSKTVEQFPNRKHMFVRFKNDIIFSMRHMKLKYRLFRIFVFLPIVAILRKKRDYERLTKFSNMRIRREFVVNIFLLIGAYFYTLLTLGKILRKRQLIRFLINICKTKMKNILSKIREHPSAIKLVGKSYQPLQLLIANCMILFTTK